MINIQIIVEGGGNPYVKLLAVLIKVLGLISIIFERGEGLNSLAYVAFIQRMKKRFLYPWKLIGLIYRHCCLLDKELVN